jgi:hypothetical protein
MKYKLARINRNNLIAAAITEKVLHDINPRIKRAETA